MDRFLEREDLVPAEVEEIKSHLDKLCRVNTPYVRGKIKERNKRLMSPNSGIYKSPTQIKLRKLFDEFLKNCHEMD